MSNSTIKKTDCTDKMADSIGMINDMVIVSTPETCRHNACTFPS